MRGSNSGNFVRDTRLAHRICGRPFRDRLGFLRPYRAGELVDATELCEIDHGSSDPALDRSKLCLCTGQSEETLLRPGLAQR
jgi:hypothetical protein